MSTTHDEILETPTPTTPDPDRLADAPGAGSRRGPHPASPRVGRGDVPNPQKNQGDSPLMTLGEVAAYLRISYWTARLLVVNGDLPSVRLPGGSGRGRMRRTLVHRADLEAFVLRWKERGR